MRERALEESVEISTSPSPPNFEDEVTVQRARPVVPLERIEAKVRRRRFLFLGGAFAVGMILGAVSALLASYLELQTVPQSASEVAEVEVSPEPLAVASAGEESVEESAVPITPPSETTEKKRERSVKRGSDASHSRDERRLSEEEELRRIREAILVDQWQERRRRRVERRNRGNGGGRDLSNLDEIFEGPRRP
jgi:hypothetical protein